MLIIIIIIIITSVTDIIFYFLQEVVSTVHAKVIKYGEALRLKAKQDLVDKNEK